MLSEALSSTHPSFKVLPRATHACAARRPGQGRPLQQSGRAQHGSGSEGAEAALIEYRDARSLREPSLDRIKADVDRAGKLQGPPVLRVAVRGEEGHHEDSSSSLGAELELGQPDVAVGAPLGDLSPEVSSLVGHLAPV